MDGFRHDVFLSYRRADGQRFASRLRQALVRAHRRLPVPRPGLRVYLDRVYARATEDFYRDEISPALLSSRWLLVLATPQAGERVGTTDWIAREIGDFEAARGLSAIRILHAKGAALPRLPHAIQDRMPNAQQIDLRGLGTLMPGAQTRDDWLALLATLFDLSPEDMPALRRVEETARRNRVALAAGAVAGAVVFATGVSGFALYRDAETRRLLGLSSATLGMALRDDAAENAFTCDALSELWASGAEPRAVPAVRCRIAAAWEAFVAGGEDAQAALAALGTWDAVIAALPPVTPDTGDEHREAQHEFEIDQVQYRLFQASGNWLGADPVSAAALPQFMAAAEVCLATLRDLPGSVRAYSDLMGLLWPVLDRLEADGRAKDSLALMIRVADALQAAAEADLEMLMVTRSEAGLQPDVPDRLVDYGTLRRRAAFYMLEVRGDAPAALASAEQAVAALRPVGDGAAWPTFQIALAYLVRGAARAAAGDAEGAATDRGLALYWAQRAQVAEGIEDWLWREVAGVIDELQRLGAIAATGPEAAP